MFTRDSAIISHNIKTPLTSISRAVGNILQLTYGQLVKSLFANNEQGFAYDPNDLSTMFQDSVGTIPVTAVGQPVGLMLDKSRGLVLGTNVISNSNFTSLNGWTSGPSMQAVLVQGGVQILSPTSTTGGDINSSAANHFSWAPLISLGKRFKITFDAKHVSGTGVLQVGSSFSVGLQINPNENGGVFNRYTTEVTGSLGGFATAATFGATNGSVWVINNVVSQEVIGNHSYQSTSSMRPILRKNEVTGANYLEFDGTDDFLKTNNIDFTSTDKVSLFAGLRKLNDVNYSIIAETGTTATGAGSIHLFSQGAGVGQYAFGIVGTSRVLGQTANSYPSPDSAVITANGYLSKSDVLAIPQSRNGIGQSIQLLDGPNTGGGNFANLPLYIGRRGGVASALKGHIYSLIGIGRLTTDAETKALEKLIAKNTGVALS